MYSLGIIISIGGLIAANLIAASEIYFECKNDEQASCALNSYNYSQAALGVLCLILSFLFPCKACFTLCFIGSVKIENVDSTLKKKCMKFNTFCVLVNIIFVLS